MLALRHPAAEALPLLGELFFQTVVEPVDVRPAREYRRAENEFTDPPRVPLGVRDGERRAPGAAEDQPAVDPRMSAQGFDVVE